MKSRIEPNPSQSKYIWRNNYPSLRSWKIGSFKSIDKPVEVELAPLTVVVGANSAGKSSLLQSILMMAQNSTSVNREVTPQLRGNLELNSYLVQLGSMKETVCDFTERKNRKFSIELGGIWFSGDRPISHFQNRGIEGSRQLRRESTIEKGHGGVMLDWDTELVPLGGEKESGIAVVSESNASITINGVIEQKVNARIRRQLAGFDVAKSKYDQFSFEHSSALGPSREVSKSADLKNDLADALYTEQNDAVCFRSALPISGLQLVNIVEYIFRHQAPLYYDAKDRNYSYQVNSISESDLRGDDSIFETLELAADAYLNELVAVARAILQQDQVADELSISILSNKVEQLPFISPIRIPFNYIRRPGAVDKYEDRKAESNNFLDLVKTKLNVLYGNSEWIEREVLCSPDGRRTRNPIYKNSKTASVIELWNRYLSESILYLGPLRAAPKSTYGLGSGTVNSNIPIGESGEYLAKTLFNERILRRYPVLESGELRPSRITLEEAVSSWYHELCIVPETENSIAVQDPGRQGYQLNIGKRTLANVGFGVSQILPVIAICLMAKPGDLVLLEQPELHLNPGMQQKLADFLLHMVKTGRQIIVETHSEYLITRLRRNAAMNESDHRYFGIIFAEREPETGTSYRTVNVNDHGDLSEWPKGFFDQVAEDLRVLMRRAAERRESSPKE